MSSYWQNLLKTFDLAVVGSGIAAHALLEECLRERFSGSILWVSAPAQLPPCSLFSTATVARQGVRRGVSELGDLLCEGGERFFDWCQEVRPPGVEKLHNWYLGPAFERRFGVSAQTLTPYEQGHLVDAPVFFEWWSARLHSGLKLHWKQALVTALAETEAGVELQTWGGECLRAGVAVLAGGAFAQLFPLTRESLAGKAVPGHFLAWDKVDWKRPTTRWAQGPWNLLYRSKHKTLCLGGSSEKDGIVAPRHKQFENPWREFANLFEGLPPLDRARLVTGIRHRGEKRMPYAGLLKNYTHTYALTGLYKSGFTLAWSLAPKVWRKIKRRGPK